MDLLNESVVIFVTTRFLITMHKFALISIRKDSQV